MFTFTSSLVDTNGTCGIFANGAYAGGASSLVKNLTGGTLTSMTFSNAGGIRTLTPVTSTASSLIGAFEPSSIAGQSYAFFDTNGHYLIASTQVDTGASNPSNTLAGVEAACYTASNGTAASGNLSWDLTAACILVPAAGGTRAITAVDTNGTAGLSNATPPIPFTITGANTIQFGSGANATIFNRVVPQ